MSQSLERTVPAADVIRKGEAITLPNEMKIDDAIAVLLMRKKYEEEEVVIIETFNAFPYDGACAFDDVLTEVYGWAPAVARETWMGKQLPQLMSIEIGYEQVRQVPWGDIQIPGVEGKLTTGGTQKEGRWVFTLAATVRRMSEGTIRALYVRVRERIKTHSIYRGKAIKLRFLDDDGDALPMPQPKFLDTESIRPEMLVYAECVQRAIQTNLFTPISRPLDCLANGIPVKRGVLLGGIYGTGKTLAAAVASKLAVAAGVTYVYIPRADELAHAIEFAKQYQSPACVVFCEDVDRVTAGERSVKMDDLLNTIDGIDAKNANIVVVLTTNHLEHINPAMLRPGRLDAVIEVTPPDAGAVQRLLRLYGGGAISAEEDLGEVGAHLAGQIPAVIAEVVRRAKLSQLALQPAGTLVERITALALLEAAETMKAQIALLAGKPTKAEPDKLTAALQAAMGDAPVVLSMREHLEQARGDLARVKEAVA